MKRGAFSSGTSKDSHSEKPGDIRFMRKARESSENEKATSKVKKSGDRWTKLIEDYQDNMIKAKQLIRSKRGTAVSEESDFYTKENLAKGKVLEQTERFLKEYNDPAMMTGAEMAVRFGVTLEEIGDYLYARHAPERNRVIREKNPKIKFDPAGMSDRDAAKIVKAFEEKVTDTDLRDKFIGQIQAMNTYVNDKRLESGLISKKTHQMLKDMYTDYVPLRGYEENFDQPDLTVFSPLMHAKGRDSKAFNPIPYLVTAAQEAILKGENNKVRQSLLQFVKENPSKGEYYIRNAWYVHTGEFDDAGNPIWMEQKERPTKLQIAYGQAVKSVDPEVQRAVRQAHGKNDLAVMVDGRKVFINFKDSTIPQTIKGKSLAEMGILMKKLSAYTRWLSSMYTQYSPEFGVRNLTRDVGFGTYNIMVEHDAKTAGQTVAEMRKSMPTLMKHFWSQEYGDTEDMKLLREFKEAGGMTGFSDFRNVQEIFDKAQKQINKLDEQGVWNGTKKLTKEAFDPVLRGVDTYNRAFENAMRFSFYKVLRREKGYSEQKAAAAAKDLTVNFNRRGNKTNVMGSLYIFFNATVQGFERQARQFADPKLRKKALIAAGSVMAMGFAQSLMLDLITDDDEEGISDYDKIPAYAKKMNMIFPTFTKGNFIKVPLPYGINVFYAMGESLGRVLTGRAAAGEEALGLLTTMSDSFSPLGGYEFDDEELNPFGKMLLFATPSAARPLTDLAWNRDFTGRKIYREASYPGQLKQPNSQSHYPGVNPGLKKMTDLLNTATGGNKVEGGVIDINPEWLDYGINQYFGGPVSFGKNLAGTAAALVAGENVLADPNYRKLPFVRSYVQKVGSNFEIRQHYYENMDKVRKVSQTMNRYMEEDRKQGTDYRQKNIEILRLHEYGKQVDKDVRELTSTINELSKREDPSSRERVEQLQDRRAMIMEKFNKRYNKTVRRPKKVSAMKDLLD